MNLKKAIPFFLIVVVLLSACSKRGKEPQGEEKPTEDVRSKSEIMEPVQLTWFSDVNFYSPPATWTTDENTVQGQITKATGLTFKMDIPLQEGATKLSLMLVNNSLPDIMTITSNDMMNQLIESGKVWKLEELLKEYDPQSHLLKEFPEDVKEAIVHTQGDWYSYPSHINAAGARTIYPPSSAYYEEIIKTKNNNAIFFNGDILERAGLTIEDVKTEEQLLAAFEKVKKLNLEVNGELVIPFLIDGSNYKNSMFNDAAIMYLANTFGAMPIDSEGNYRDILMAPEMKHVFKFLNTTVMKGYLDPNAIIMDNSIINDYLVSERVFCFIGNTANIHFHKMENKNFVSPGAILSGEGKVPVLGILQQAGIGWMQTFISKDCKYPDRVAKWLSWMSSREGMLLHTYGFEGIHYNWENGFLVQTEKGLEDRDNYMETGVYAYWAFHHNSFIQSVLPAPSSEEEIMIFDIQTALGKNPKTVIYDVSLINNIPTNLIEPNSELGIADTKIIAFREAQIIKLIMAENDTMFNNLYDEFISTMKDYGIDKINAARNEAYEENCRRYNKILTSVNGD